MNERAIKERTIEWLMEGKKFMKKDQSQNQKGQRLRPISLDTGDSIMTFKMVKKESSSRDSESTLKRGMLEAEKKLKIEESEY